MAHMRWLAAICVVFLVPRTAQSSRNGGKKIIGSYCTNNQCNLSAMLPVADEVNAFSVTSYHLNSSGLLQPCSQNTSACGWSGSVQEFNQDAQRASRGSLTAIPLVFNNAGSMVSNFRSMVDLGLQSEATAFLVSEALQYEYETVSLDLEPSCWQDSASLCDFPTTGDVRQFHDWIDGLAVALHEEGRKLTVAAGGYPVSQCDGGEAQYRLCTEDYASQCARDALNVSTCNCCAFTTWFEPSSLCRTRADRIVNMDTYMHAPFDETLFHGAMDWYLGAGCTPDRLAAGLLSSEAQSDDDAHRMFAAIEQSGVPEIDIWVNFWGNSTAVDLWRSGAVKFLDGGRSGSTSSTEGVERREPR